MKKKSRNNYFLILYPKTFENFKSDCIYIYIYIYIYVYILINENQRAQNYSKFNATSSFMRFKQSSDIYLVS